MAPKGEGGADWELSQKDLAYKPRGTWDVMVIPQIWSSIDDKGDPNGRDI
jgi:hypothetical protein